MPIIITSVKDDLLHVRFYSSLLFKLFFVTIKMIKAKRDILNYNKTVDLVLFTKKWKLNQMTNLKEKLGNVMQ